MYSVKPEDIEYEDERCCYSYKIMVEGTLTYDVYADDSEEAEDKLDGCIEDLLKELNESELYNVTKADFDLFDWQPC